MAMYGISHTLNTRVGNGKSQRYEMHAIHRLTVPPPLQTSYEELVVVSANE
jgi:hypothetical protein